MECILKNMKNKSHLSEIIYESYLHTIFFLTTPIFLLTIGYARKHLVHHCSYNSEAGICISWTLKKRNYFRMSQRQYPLDLPFPPISKFSWSPQLEYSCWICPLITFFFLKTCNFDLFMNRLSTLLLPIPRICLCVFCWHFCLFSNEFTPATCCWLFLFW